MKKKERWLTQCTCCFRYRKKKLLNVE